MTDKIVESRLTTYSKVQNATPKEIAVAALDSKKADDIQIIELQNSYTDALVVATGSSNTHVQTLADAVQEWLHKAGHVVDSVEGMPNNQWVIVDAGDVVAHIFTPEIREHYNIEKLYAHNFDEDTSEDESGDDLTGS